MKPAAWHDSLANFPSESDGSRLKVHYCIQKFAPLTGRLSSAMTSRAATVAAAILLSALSTYGVELSPDREGYQKQIVPFMDQFCLSCHDEDVQKGDVRFDTIDNDIVAGADVTLWRDILHRLETGEMPPEKKKEQPTEAETRGSLQDWISGELRRSISSPRWACRGGWWCGGSAETNTETR